MLEKKLNDQSDRFSMLIVDDEPANLNLLTRTFRKEYDLHTARDGVEGLNLLKNEPVDLIMSHLLICIMEEGLPS